MTKPRLTQEIIDYLVSQGDDQSVLYDGKRNIFLNMTNKSWYVNNCLLGEYPALSLWDARDAYQQHLIEAIKKLEAELEETYVNDC